jgi:hypothetical protein
MLFDNVLVVRGPGAREAFAEVHPGALGHGRRDFDADGLLSALLPVRGAPMDEHELAHARKMLWGAAAASRARILCAAASKVAVYVESSGGPPRAWAAEVSRVLPGHPATFSWTSVEAAPGPDASHLVALAAGRETGPPACRGARPRALRRACARRAAARASGKTNRGRGVRGR